MVYLKSHAQTTPWYINQALCLFRAKAFRMVSFSRISQMWLPHGSCCSSRTKGREWSLTCTFSRSPSRLSPVTVPQRVHPSSSVQPMRTSIPNGTDWSRFSCIVCLTACRAFRFMSSRTVPMDWGMDVLVIISCPFMKNIPSKETVGIRLRPCPARRLHR